MWGNSIWGLFTLAVAFALAPLGMSGHDEWKPWLYGFAVAIGVLAVTALIVYFRRRGGGSPQRSVGVRVSGGSAVVSENRIRGYRTGISFTNGATGVISKNDLTGKS